VTSHIPLPLTGTSKETLLHLRELQAHGPSTSESGIGPSAPGKHHRSPPEIPASVRNEPQQEPRTLSHLAISSRFSTVRSNQCLSTLAWVHLQTRHLGNSIFRKVCLLPSGISMSHDALLPASFTWQLQLSQTVDHQGLLQEQIQPVPLCSVPVPPAEDTTDETGHPEETCRLTYSFASQAASATHMLVQIAGADLPPPSTLPSRSRVQPARVGGGQRSAVVPDAAVRGAR